MPVYPGAPEDVLGVREASVARRSGYMKPSDRGIPDTPGLVLNPAAGRGRRGSAPGSCSHPAHSTRPGSGPTWRTRARRADRDVAGDTALVGTAVLPRQLERLNMAMGYAPRDDCVSPHVRAVTIERVNLDVTPRVPQATPSLRARSPVIDVAQMPMKEPRVEAKASKYSVPATPVGITWGPRRASSKRVVPLREWSALDAASRRATAVGPQLPVSVLAACQPISTVCGASVIVDHDE